MNGCYCANFYGSANCRNVVPDFGERCKLCKALKTGASLREGLLPNVEFSVPSRPAPLRKDSTRTDAGTTGGRSSRSSTTTTSYGYPLKN